MKSRSRRQPPPEEHRSSPSQGTQQGYKRNPQEKTRNSFWDGLLNPEFHDDLSGHLNKLQIQRYTSIDLKAQAPPRASWEEEKPERKIRNRLDLFQDESFGHNNKSVLGECPDGITLEELRDSPWRPLHNTHKLVVGIIEYKDVQQRILGDCYFLAVVCALVKIKGRILNIFSIEKMSQGAYEVTCYYMGQKQVKILDSYFPYKNDETFTGTNGKESWVLLLEKAFAKMFGSYAAIEGGFSPEAMRFLTGAPTRTFFISDLSDDFKEGNLWDLLADRNSEYLFTCSIGKESEELRKVKLAGNHVYTILDAFETFFGEKLLLIRNPWGAKDAHGIGEWEGKWSDKYLQEHIEMLTQLPYEYKGEDDGVFHISYDDFLNYFESVEVCYLHKDFDLLESEKTISKTNETKYFPITVEDKTTSFFIMVNQESKRKLSPFSGYFGFESSEICFNVCDSKGKWVFKKDITGYDEQVWEPITLSPGKYEVGVRIRWSDFALDYKKNHFVLNIYGPKNVY